MAKQHFLSPQDIENIINNTSIVDYFHYLADKGRLKFDRQRGHDYYFLTENEKYSVSDTPRKGYYDFKAGEGGQIIKAVMKFEEKSWREAVDFLKDFSNTYIPETEKQGRQNAENKIPTPAQEVDFSPKNVLVRTFVPNNDKLLAYFAGRGISKEILQQYAQQVHYHNKTSGKDYFGIGIPNQSGGYDVKSLLDKPYDKAKVGVSDISIIPGTRNEAVVFEGMTDMFSYLQMAKDNGKPNDRTLVVLNSVTNTGTFIDRFKNYTGKIHLFLDGDKAGNDATQNILNSLKNSVDERGRYGIGKGEINDLNDFHLKVFNSLRNPNKSRTFASDNNIQIQTQNGSTTIEPNRVSSPKLVGEQPLEPNLREPLTTSQSQQERTHPSRQAVGSDNAGNGLSSSERSDLGGRTGRPEMGSNIGAQQEILPNQRPLSTEEHRSTGRDIPNGDRPRPQGDGEQLPKDSVRPTLLNKSNSTKVSNEEITILVNSLTFVADDNTI